MQLDLIKQHLNLHLLIKRFMIEYGLGNQEQRGRASSDMSLGELFQPFLLEYIRLQEDQFIKYAHKIYDVSRINQLAEEIAHMIEHSRVVLLSMSSLDVAGSPVTTTMTTNGTNGSPFGPNSQMMSSTNGGGLGSPHGFGVGGGGGGGSGGPAGNNNLGLSSEIVDKYSIDYKSTKAIYDLENYYSASVTDFFTIMHELLQTLLSFDSADPNANLPHQMGFVNLIKSKLLGYSAHVKKEFQKIYKQARGKLKI